MSDHEHGPLDLPPEFRALMDELSRMLPEEKRCCPRQTLRSLLAIARGHLVVPEVAEENRPLGEITVRDLGRLMGIQDLEAARKSAAATRAAQEESHREAWRYLADIKGLRGAGQHRCVSLAEIDALANAMKAGLSPNVAIIVLAAFVDEAARYAPIVTPIVPSGAN